MAKRAKPATKRGQTASKLPKVGAGELLTLLDFVRYAASRFTEAELVFAHGTTDPVAEVATTKINAQTVRKCRLIEGPFL